MMRLYENDYSLKQLAFGIGSCLRSVKLQAFYSKAPPKIATVEQEDRPDFFLCFWFSPMVCLQMPH